MDHNGSEGYRSISLAKQISRSFKMEEVGSLLHILELDGDLDGDISERA